MTLLGLLGLALLLLALAMLLPALLRSPRPAPTQAGSLAPEPNLALLREQKAQLDEQLGSGAIGPAQYALASSELEQRVLDEAAPAAAPPSHAGGDRRSALLLGLVLPLLALALYGWLGQPQAVLPPELQAGAAAEPTQAQVEAMVAQLAKRLDEQPSGQPPDPQAWEMLARAYASLQRFEESNRAYIRAGELAPRNAQLLADHADVLAMVQGQSAAGEPTRLIERALAIDPKNLKALALAGTAALQRQDPGAAVVFWSRAQALAPPDSEFAAGLASSLDVARAQLLAAAPKGSRPAASAPAAPALAISGTVSLAPALAAQLAASDTVFVFARAVQGSRMPLAILKFKASELPRAFTLDDSSAMSPDLKLSGAGQVMLVARVSRSGNAMPQAGDLIGELGPVKPGAPGLRLVINSVQP